MADPRPDAGDRPPLDGSRAGRDRRIRASAGLVLILVAAVLGSAALVGLALSPPRGDPPADASASTQERGSASAAPGAASPPGPAVAAPSPAGASSAAPAGRHAIGGAALVAVVDAGGALATVDDHGGSRVDYPAPGIVFGFPAWSPDGSRIAVVGEDGAGTGVYVFSVPPDGGPGKAPSVVYRSPDRPPFYLYWTPDGRRISFLTGEAEGIALRVARVDGGAILDGNDRASVVRRGAPLYFEWIGATRLLLHVGVGQDAFMGTVGLDGALVGAPIAGTGLFRPASQSGDGRYVAYARSTSATTGEIVVERPDGSGSHRIPAFGPAAMLFDPAGDSLAAIGADAPGGGSQELPVGPLRLVDPATGAVRTLLDGPVVAFFWSPDGRTIAALRAADPGQGPQANRGSGIVAARAAAPSSGTTPIAGAAGVAVDLALVDRSTGTIRSERVVRLADPFVSDLLPYFDQYALSHRLWSPDGASILLPLVGPDGTPALTVVPADGSDPRPIAHGSRGFWRP